MKIKLQWPFVSRKNYVIAMNTIENIRDQYIGLIDDLKFQLDASRKGNAALVDAGKDKQWIVEHLEHNLKEALHTNELHFNRYKDDQIMIENLVKQVDNKDIALDNLRRELDSVQNAYTMYKGQQTAWANAIEQGNATLVENFEWQSKELVQARSDVEDAGHMQAGLEEELDRLTKLLKKSKVTIRALNWLLTPQQKKTAKEVVKKMRGKK